MSPACGRGSHLAKSSIVVAERACLVEDHTLIVSYLLQPSSMRYTEGVRANIRHPGMMAPGGINMADISSDLFMDAVLAYQQTAAIKAAVELDIFSEIRKGNERPEFSRGQPGRRFVVSAYFATISPRAAISKSTLISIGSLNLRRHSWTAAPRHGWAAWSSIWPRLK